MVRLKDIKLKVSIMNNPKISVVISTFCTAENGRKEKLKRAIQSVLDQSFQDFEIIVVDDASPDSPKEVVESFGDKRIFYLRREENWGSHSKPKNDGIKAAKADLIAFLDDDNNYLKDHLQALYVAKERNPHVQMVFGDRWIVDDSGQNKRGIGINAAQIEEQLGIPTNEDGWHPMVLQVKNYIDTSDVLIEKQALYRLGGWDESLKKFADWNLWIRFAKANFRAKNVPLPLTEYHIHADMAQLRHPSPVGPNGEVMPTFSPDACPIFAAETSLCEEPPVKVCVLTVAWHRLPYTKKTVETMRAKAGYDFDHVIFFQEMDNEEKEWTRRKNFKAVLGSDKNEGVPHAYNKMLDAMKALEGEGKYDLVVLTDNDCEFKSDNWLADIVDIYKRQQKLIISPYIEGLRDNPGGAERTGLKEFGVPKHGYVGDHFLGFSVMQGNICQAIPRAFFDIFTFDEDTFLHGTQSIQVSRAALENGFLLAYAEQIIVEHMDTTGGQAKNYPKEFELSQQAKTIKRNQ